MLSIHVELLSGTIRAGSADDLALTGADPGEWPPSPARLFSALVAADGTGSRCRATTGAELIPLEEGQPPIILADPRVCRSPLAHRFVVVDQTSEGAVQDYPARRAAQVRPGCRISPFWPTVTYHWPDLNLDRGLVDALAYRAARVGYLGCSDSAVRVRVSDQPDPGASPRETWEPTSDIATADVSLPVGFPGLLSVLDDAYERFTAGEPVRRSWFPTRRQWYRVQRPDDTMGMQPIVVWLRFERSEPGRLALAVTDTLRRATLELYDRWAADGLGDIPPVLTGHGFSGKGYQHCHWFTLPDVGGPYSKGRLHGAAIWFPPDTPMAIVGGVNAALVHLRELVLPGGRRIKVQRNDQADDAIGGNRSAMWSASPQRWSGPSRKWVSVLPVVHERWGPVTMAEVESWCAHAGLARPMAYQTSRMPLLEGALSLAPSEVFRDGSERRPYSHLRVEFTVPVRGPVILGRGRQFGMGLLCPVDQHTGAPATEAEDA